MKKVFIILLTALFLVSSAFSPIKNSDNNADSCRLIYYTSVQERDNGTFEFSYRQEGDGQVESSTIIVIPYTEEYRNELKKTLADQQVQGRASTSVNVTDVDLTSSFYISLTSVASSVSINGEQYWKLDSASCTLTGSPGTSGSYMGSGVSIVSQSLTAGTSGNGYNNATVSQNDSQNYGASVRSWTYNAPTGWQRVKYDTAYCQIGSAVTVTAQRGANGSVWSTTIRAIVFGS